MWTDIVCPFSDLFFFSDSLMIFSDLMTLVLNVL